MHNRARLLTASFLVKDLGIDWRLGAAALLRPARRRRRRQQRRQLAMGGRHGNRHASEPCLQPDNSQAKRFDPDGDYVRRYVPELAASRRACRARALEARPARAPGAGLSGADRRPRRGGRPLSQCASRVGGLRLEPATLQLLGRRATDVPDEPDAFEAANHRSTTRRPAGAARPCRADEREGVMVVVPPLAEHEDRDQPVVAGLITGAEVAASEHVADRVHREGRVLVGEDPHEASPDEPGQARLEGAPHRRSRSRRGSRG